MDQQELVFNLVQNHLEKRNLQSDEQLWCIKESPLNGRGVFARRDIQTGEIIFIDYPLLFGPRAGTNVKQHCIICSNTVNLKACSQGCGLPICNTDCEESQIHQKECCLIKNLNKNGFQNEICVDLFRALTPLRGLLLSGNSEKLLRILACNLGKIHGFEVELAKRHLNLSEEQETFLKIVCFVLDSNAYEAVVKLEDVQVLRGLYPLSSLMNHNCTPNTTHLFDKDQQMIVKATVPINKGCEIFASYTSLLWATAARRHHLMTTKHFLCECERCQDPTEFGSDLSGLKCQSEQPCTGILYPVSALINKSKWQCNHCKQIVSSHSIGVLQSALGSILRTVDVTSVERLIFLIKNRVENVVPPRNHIAIELKIRVIWLLGHSENITWCDIPFDQLCFKIKLCNDLLDLLKDLRLGQCKMKGLILFELYRSLIEVKLRKQHNANLEVIEQILDQDTTKIQKEISEILANDVTVPDEIQSYIIN